MFEQEAGTQRDCLRQGDILKGIPFPVLDLNNLQILGRIEPPGGETNPSRIIPTVSQHRADPNYLTGQTLIRLAFGCVVSHCCELEPRHGRIISAVFLIARVISVKASILNDDEKLKSLRENRDPRAALPSYIDYFYIKPHALIENNEWMVDFSQVVAIPGVEFPAILGRKVLQMDNRSRVKLKIKLAVYFGRITNEEDDEGLNEPWR